MFPSLLQLFSFVQVLFFWKALSLSVKQGWKWFVTKQLSFINKDRLAPEHHLSFFKKNPGLALFGQITPGTVSCSQELQWVQTLAPATWLESGKQRYNNDESVCTPVDFAELAT